MTAAKYDFGPHDERGALNLVGPAATRRGLACASTGQVVSLSLSTAPGVAPIAPMRTPLQHFMARDGGDYAAGLPERRGFGFADDSILLACHGTTHLDALAHVWQDGVMYNGYSASEVTSRGARRCGIEKSGPFVTRGFLVDAVPDGAVGLDPGQPVPLSTLVAALSGVQPELGDALLLRTGWINRWRQDPSIGATTWPGLDTDCVDWILSNGFALVGADTIGVEVCPSTDPACVYFPTRPPDTAALVAEVRAAAKAVVGPAVVGSAVVAPERTLDALADATDRAMYWQEPDADDLALARPEVIDALAPVAAALAAAAPGWWSAPVDLDRQRLVEWLEPESYATSAALTGTAERLDRWRADAVADEARAVVRPADIRALISGGWWSTPAPASLPTTTRALPGAGPVGLACVEDGFGWTEARCRPVAPVRSPRVYEVHRPADWVDLVRRYPMETTRSRRHDWWRATGVEGRWLIPDYRAVAGDHDAVHVSALGYLTTAGTAHPVTDALPGEPPPGGVPPGEPPRGGAGLEVLTTLAGWPPDTTYWLTDCLRFTGPPEYWRVDRSGPRQFWTRTG